MKKQNLGDIIFEDLKKRIFAGEFKLEDKLPSERLLAEYYKVSRIPVREAIKKLEDAGVVSKMPGSKTIITSIPILAQEPSSGSIPTAEGVHVLTESLHVRRLIESEAAKAAAIHASAQGLERLQQALFESISEIRKLKIGEENHFCEADLKFHRTIAEESGNPFFLQCLDSMPGILNWHQCWSLYRTPSKDDVIPYHTLIFDSILDHNPDLAYESMFKHISRVEELINSMKIV